MNRSWEKRLLIPRIKYTHNNALQTEGTKLTAPERYALRLEQCCATRYIPRMIKSFKHKGIKKFYEKAPGLFL